MNKNIMKILNVLHRALELITRGIFLLLAYLTGPGETQPPIKDLTLLHSATALAFKIKNKQLSSVEVVQSYIDRIKEIQPVLNCMVEDRFEKALEDAKKSDDDNNHLEKPLLGIPFTTKDCIAISGMRQTAGLSSRCNIISNKDAEVVRLMKAAGAIPIATSNVSELAMWWESSNCLYGTTKNPYNTRSDIEINIYSRHIVGGSSGGEGCIQAAAGSPIGIGSDIGGSIRMPAFFNGIFGHQPSKGIVSIEGQYPTPHNASQQQLLGLGPMCRYAQDLKLVLKVISDKNAEKLRLDEKVDVSKIKFYYMEDSGGEYLVSPVDPEIKRAMKGVIDYLKTAHQIKSTKLNLKKMKKSLPLWRANMMASEGKNFTYELSNRKGHINVWWELLKWGLFMSSHTLIALLTAIFEKLGMEFGSEQHSRLLQESRDFFQEFKEILGEDGVFLYPTHPTTAPLHNEPIIKPFNFSYTAIINVLGLPSTACPLGLSKQGLPLGIQVIGGLNQDRLTIAVAEELERAFGGWVPPPICDIANS